MADGIVILTLITFCTLIVHWILKNILTYRIQAGQQAADANKHEREQTHKHEEILKKIEKEESVDIRKNELEIKKMDQDHERKLQSQSQTNEILKEVYRKIPSADMGQAISCSYLMQSLENGQAVSKNVLELIGNDLGSFQPAIEKGPIEANLPQLTNEDPYESASEAEFKNFMDSLSTKSTDSMKFQPSAASDDQPTNSVQENNLAFIDDDEHIDSKRLSTKDKEPQSFNSLLEKAKSAVEFDVDQALYVTYILKCIQADKPIDQDVVNLLTEKESIVLSDEFLSSLNQFLEQNESGKVLNIK